MMLRSSPGAAGAAVVVAILLAILLAPGGAEAAGVSARLSFGQLRYTLTDLDPNDGVTPSISFVPLSATRGAPGFIGLGYYDADGLHTHTADGVAREPLALSTAAASLLLDGSASGLDDPRSWTLDADAASWAPAGQAVAIDARVLSGQQAFVLSPHTALTITATAHETWRTDVDAPFSYFAVDPYLVLSTQDPLGPSYAAVAPERPVSGWAPFDYTGSASASYANLNAVSVDGVFELDADVSIFRDANPVSPVPEPSKPAMYAASLPLLLALRRRARRMARV